MILMQSDSSNALSNKNIRFIIGDVSIIGQMKNIHPMKPFSDEALSFLNDLSRSVMQTGKAYSDVATFGFWCRRSALIQEKNKYDDIASRLGRGIVYHIAPSNVPVNFAFSFVAGLLAGNANIVRLPSKNFDQVNIIAKVINELLETNHQGMKPYISMIQYPYDSGITDSLSAMCDSRIIWGGDQTITEIRRSPLNPRANEITFADRYSIAVINADEYMKAEDKDKIAQDFYNDTYFTDQNACTAPRLIVWIGNRKEAAKEEFWESVHWLAAEKYSLAPIQAVGKLHALYKTASRYDIKCEMHKDQYITRVKVDMLDGSLMDYKYNSGFFFEYDADELNEIIPILSERCQTLTYFGLSQIELKQFLDEYKPNGVDRAVPMGRSMDFSLVWDGYDTIRSLSRKVLIL